MLGLFNRVGPGEIFIIAGVLVFFFGAKKLPELARSLGRSARELRKGLAEGEDDEGSGDGDDHTGESDGAKAD
jgi:sec-independent protein translocase protein TatA